MTGVMTGAARPSLAPLPPARPAPNPLVAAAAALHRLVDRSLGKDRAPASNPAALAAYRDELAAIEAAEDWTALRRLSTGLRLLPFERDLVLLCAAVQVSPALLDGVAATAKGQPTLALASVLFNEPAWSALSPSGPLARHRLLSADPAEPMLLAGLRIDDCVLAYLLVVGSSDPRLLDLVESLSAPAFLPSSHETIAARITALWRDGAPGFGSPRVIQLASEDASAARAIAARACAALGLPLVMLRHWDVPAVAGERVQLARLWEREHAMNGTALLLDLADESDAGARPALELAELLEAPLVLTSREPCDLRRADVARIDVMRPNAHEQMDVWRHALPPGVVCPPDALAAVAAQFRGGWATAEAVAATLRGSLAPVGAPAAQGEAEGEAQPAPDVGQALHQACRVASRRRLDNLAARISSSVGWDDLVVPAHTAKALREITAQLRHRARVYETWGFGARSERGLGISALFHGDSGTGKTLAAEIIANELALDLYRVDLSRVVSKYIGETEKNLRRVFDAAEESGAILLFDEADALFGKRSDVKDSHDRYANLEVSYLLSRMETYRGLAILTTNFRQALDQAFLRRLRFIVHFSFPDTDQRAAIWRRAFPAQTPTRGLDPARLARLAVTGGSIRNIALAAAFLAADAGEPVTPAHVLQAAATEYGKLNKSLTESETRGWSS